MEVKKRNMKNDNIIRFYILANKLKNIIRRGWIEIGIDKERLESDAEHIYGTLMLAIAINSEYKLNLDMYKVLKMLTLHETEEILMTDYTVRDTITRDEKLKQGKICVKKVVSGLAEEKEIRDLLYEFSTRSTPEAVFAHLVDKIECDFQAKLYDLEGVMDYNRAREDLIYYGSRAEEIDAKSKTAADFWIEYDRPKYKDDKIFRELIEDIKNIDIKQYQELMNINIEGV